MTATAAVEFDPVSSTFFDDPYDTYRRLRDEAPVYFNEQYGFWALSRHEDVLEASRNWPEFSSARGIDLYSLTQGGVSVEMIIMMDPPRHDRLRLLVSRVFTPRSIAALEPMIRDVILSFLEPLEGRERFDITGECFAPFPVEIISRMLGVPAADRQQIRHCLDRGLHREPGQLAPSEDSMLANLEMAGYFLDLVADKRKHPGDDMLSRLIEAEVVDDEGQTQALTDNEIAGFAGLIGGAGAETVTKLLGNMVMLFRQFPDEYERVLADPALIPPAIEEALRMQPPSQYQGRMSAKDVELHGRTIPADAPVILITGAATRDERAFERPDEFIIDRPPHLSLAFGYGVHSCLGAALARMEARIAIEEVIARWPRYDVDEAGLERVQMINVAGYSGIPFIPVTS